VSELNFAIVGAHAERYAASPQLALRVRVTETTGVPVHAIALRVQVRIDPARRRYDGEESARLTELFGGPERYGDTLRSLLWAHVSQTVLAFTGEAEFELPIPCSYDFEVAASKYLSALQGGEIPLTALFAGTVFVRGESGGVASELVSWSCESHYRMPAAVWRETIDAFFPNSAWLRIDRETFDELYRFKIAGGFPTWEAALGRLIAEARSTP
jgi:uncharacterized protein DUF6084